MPKKPGLNAKQKRFCQEYLIDLNGTQAALRAGYGKTEKAASVHAARLLGNARIMVEIQNAMHERNNRTQIDADFTVKRLAWLADSNIKKVAEWGSKLVKTRRTSRDGESFSESEEDVSYLNIKDSKELDDATAYGIESVQLKSSKDGPSVLIKMRNPVQALELLAKHQGLLESGSGKPEDDSLRTALEELDEEDRESHQTVIKPPENPT